MDDKISDFGYFAAIAACSAAVPYIRSKMYKIYTENFIYKTLQVLFKFQSEVLFKVLSSFILRSVNRIYHCSVYQLISPVPYMGIH
jgi:predicted ATPase